MHPNKNERIGKRSSFYWRNPALVAWRRETSGIGAVEAQTGESYRRISNPSPESITSYLGHSMRLQVGGNSEYAGLRITITRLNTTQSFTISMAESQSSKLQTRVTQRERERAIKLKRMRMRDVHSFFSTFCTSWIYIYICVCVWSLIKLPSIPIKFSKAHEVGYVNILFWRKLNKEHWREKYFTYRPYHTLQGALENAINFLPQAKPKAETRFQSFL